MSETFQAAYDEGSRLFHEQRFDEAVTAFARAASCAPDDYRPWEMTGCCHGNRSRWEQCVEAFERSRALGHECGFCCYNRAAALLQLMRADEALVAIDRAIELEPQNISALYARGRVLGLGYGRGPREMEIMDGRHEKAVAAFDRVIALQPEHFGAWYGKAYTLYKISHSAQATQNLLALGYAPDILQEALACVEHALVLKPGNEQAEAARETIKEWIDECRS